MKKLIIAIAMLPSLIFAGGTFGDIPLDAPVDVDVITNLTSITEKLDKLSVDGSGIYRYPGDWSISLNDISITLGGNVVTNRIGSNSWYSVETMAGENKSAFEVEYTRQKQPLLDEHWLVPLPETFRINDPMNIIESVEGSKIYSKSDTNGMFSVTADNGESIKTAYGRVNSFRTDYKKVPFWTYVPGTAAHTWSTAVLEKFEAVDDAEANLTDIYQCRHPTNAYVRNVYSYAEAHRRWPRFLSRFGSDGRDTNEEWETYKEVNNWFTDKPGKFTFYNMPKVNNKEFFWPELQKSLLPLSCSRNENNYYCRSFKTWVVAPHYALVAKHVDWCITTQRFMTDIENDEYITTSKAYCLYPLSSFSFTDLAVVKFRDALPEQCIGKFIKPEDLETLFPTPTDGVSQGYRGAIGVFVSSHQFVHPGYVSYHGNYSTYPSNPKLPSSSTNQIGDTMESPYRHYGLEGYHKAKGFAHDNHMYDSSSPMFLVAPNGKVCFTGSLWGIGGGTGVYQTDSEGKTFLEYVDQAIRDDSGGTEFIQYYDLSELQ